jgi:hypothetical protein
MEKVYAVKLPVVDGNALGGNTIIEISGECYEGTNERAAKT